MTSLDITLLISYIIIWFINGFNFGKLARRYYRERTYWSKGYTIYWILSMIWFLASAFILAELDKSANFDAFEVLGVPLMILGIVISLYYYRPKQ